MSMPCEIAAEPDGGTCNAFEELAISFGDRQTRTLSGIIVKDGSLLHVFASRCEETAGGEDSTLMSMQCVESGRIRVPDSTGSCGIGLDRCRDTDSSIGKWMDRQ